MDQLQRAEQLRTHGLAAITTAAEFNLRKPPSPLVAALRHYGIEAVNLAAEMEAEAIAGLAIIPRDELGRLRCCGAGPDQRDTRTGEDLHMPYCTVAARGIASCRDSLGASR
jgi:hypothetical protein